MKCWTQVSTLQYRGYIYEDFIVNLFLTWCLTFFQFRLQVWSVSSRDFLWKNVGVTVGKIGGSFKKVGWSRTSTNKILSMLPVLNTLEFWKAQDSQYAPGSERARVFDMPVF